MLNKIKELKFKGIPIDIWGLDEQKEINDYLINFDRLTNTEPKDYGVGKCVYCGVNGNRHNKGNLICDKHDRQFRSLGKILKFSRYVPNEILFNRDGASILTRNNKEEVTYTFDISLESVPLVIKYKWSSNKKSENGVYCENIAHKIRLHRYVLGVIDKSLEVDHIDFNTFNNRLHNLRAVTHAQNGINKGLKSDNTSGYIGVVYSKSINRWISRINYQGNKYNLGCYENKEDAIRARLQGEYDICGKDFSPQAHLFKEYGIVN